MTPEVLELQAFRLQESVDQVEHVEPDTATVDLREDVADLVEFEIAIQFDVGDLKLLGDALKVLVEKARVLRVLARLRGSLHHPQRLGLSLPSLSSSSRIPETT